MKRFLFGDVRSSVGICLGCALALATLVRADAPTAAEIAERGQRNTALRYSDVQTRVRMVLTAADGKRRERALDVIGRVKDGTYQSVVRFLAPQDVAGTAFLMIERGHDSEQYLYLPSIKRTRRIVARERDASFMSSDFSFADLQGIASKDASHKRLADDKIGNDACYVIESSVLPSANVSYGKLVAWIRQSDFIALRTRFFDPSGQLLKTLYTRRIRSIGGTPFVMEARMQAERTKHMTELFVDSIEMRRDLSDAEFTPTALEH